MTANTVTAVVYEPNTRAYTVTLRRRTREQAEIAYLRAVRPSLAAKVERLSRHCPELASRARKAALLVLEGAVRQARPGEVQPANGRYHRTAAVLARVKSASGDFEYLLTRGDMGQVICNCPDAQPGPDDPGAPRSRVAPHTCKHVLAAWLAE